MLKRSFRLTLLLATLAAAPAVHGQETLRVGLVTTLTGPGALLGNELKNGWDLGLATLNMKIGGLPTEMFVVDDQLKPDAAIAGIERLISRENVHVVAGILWSNIFLATYEAVLKSGRILIGTNANVQPLAGKDCNPLFMSTSWQNDQLYEATAKLVYDDGAKSIVLLAPNYQGGKDMMRVLGKALDGRVADSVLFKLGQVDFQAELSIVRAKNPAAVVVFAPGAMGIAFLKQWHALQLGKSIKLYSVAMVDNLTLPVVGEAAVGTSHVSSWDPTGSSPANQRFVRSYFAKHNKLPTEYAAQAYDAVFLLDSGIRGTGGKLDDKRAIVKAMRRVDFASVHGALSYNVNNFPIRDFFKREVVKEADGKFLLRGAGIAAKQLKDAYWAECKLTW